MIPSQLLAQWADWYTVGEQAVLRYEGLAKQASTPTDWKQLLGYLPFTGKGGFPATSAPLVNTLVGGLAGAGIGYGAGHLVSKLLPENWDRKKFRRTAALLGSGVGALPGAAMLAMNATSGKPLNSTFWFEPGYDHGEAMRARAAFSKQAFASEILVESELLKQAFEPLEGSGLGYDVAFDPIAFNRKLWEDREISSRLSLAEKAMASGAVTAASRLPGKISPLVTPMDMGRLAAGMGTGYLSGMLAGRVFGHLMGMPPNTQDLLARTGMWSGAVSVAAPAIFGN